MNTLLNKKKEPIDKLAAASGRSLGGDALRRMLRSPVAITGGVITGLFLIVAIFAPLLAPKDPDVHVPRRPDRGRTSSRARRPGSRSAWTTSAATSCRG